MLFSRLLLAIWKVYAPPPFPVFSLLVHRGLADVEMS